MLLKSQLEKPKKREQVNVVKHEDLVTRNLIISLSLKGTKKLLKLPLTMNSKSFFFQ